MDPSDRKALVLFKFKDDSEEYLVWLTYRQFMNLSEVNNIEFCKILQTSDVKTIKDLKIQMNKISNKGKT